MAIVNQRERNRGQSCFVVYYGLFKSMLLDDITEPGVTQDDAETAIALAQ